MIKTPPFCQIVRYTVFLCQAARKNYTQLDVIKYIEQSRKDYAAQKTVDEDLLRLIPEVVIQSETSNPSRKNKEIFDKSMQAFPVITIDENDGIHANEQLLAPLIHASNEIVFNLCAQKGSDLIYYEDDAFPSDTDLGKTSSSGYMLPSPPIYPFQWIRDVGVNTIACWQIPHEELTSEPLHHLLLLDMSDNKLLLPGDAPLLGKKERPLVLPQFQDALSGIVTQMVHRQWQPSYKTVIPAKFKFHDNEEEEHFYNDYRTFNRLASTVKFNTLYRIKIEEICGKNPYLAWYKPNEEDKETDHNSEHATLYFYPLRWKLRKNATNLMYFAIEFIPVRLVMGRKQNYKQMFQIPSAKIEDALIKLFDGCHLPLYYFRFAQMDNVAEDHLRHRNKTNGFVVEQDILLEIYKQSTALQMNEEEMQVHTLSDTSICSDFVDAHANTSGQFCIYRRRLKQQ